MVAVAVAGPAALDASVFMDTVAVAAAVSAFNIAAVVAALITAGAVEPVAGPITTKQP